MNLRYPCRVHLYSCTKKKVALAEVKDAGGGAGGGFYPKMAPMPSLALSSSSLILSEMAWASAGLSLSPS